MRLGQSTKADRFERHFSMDEVDAFWPIQLGNIQRMSFDSSIEAAHPSNDEQKLRHRSLLAVEALKR